MKKLVFALALLATPAFAANGSWTKIIVNGTQTTWGISYTLPINVTQTTPLFTPSGLPGAALSFLVRGASGTINISSSIFGTVQPGTGLGSGNVITATVVGTYGVATGQFGGSITTIMNNQLGQYGLTLTAPSPSTLIDVRVLERTLNPVAQADSATP